jgi:hypothetical protein
MIHDVSKAVFRSRVLKIIFRNRDFFIVFHGDNALKYKL